jgi:hypothetical protein
MNEIQFCIMMITALGVGFITPPLGLNLFVVSGITGESILKIAYRAIPFVFFMLIVTLLIAYVPAISTTLLPEIYDRTPDPCPRVSQESDPDLQAAMRRKRMRSCRASSTTSRRAATPRRSNMPRSSTSTRACPAVEAEIEAAARRCPKS